MPLHLKRYQQAESLHFITFSCYDRLPYLATPQAKDTLEAILEQTRARHEACIYAYVVMPEHIHLLINEPPAISLDQFLKVFKQMTSRKLKGDRAQYWHTRYYDRNVRGANERIEKIRYTHRNPVKRGLVQRPEDYRWSSFNHYATGLPGTITIESEHTAARREHL